MHLSRDYVFKAVRRGAYVLISGTVLAPPGSQPFLTPAYDARPQTRAFRLAYRNNSGAVPFEPHDLEPFESAMPQEIDTLKIQLPNQEVFVIESEQHPPRQGATEGRRNSGEGPAKSRGRSAGRRDSSRTRE